jgi:hypothetical protein
MDEEEVQRRVGPFSQEPIKITSNPLMNDQIPMKYFPEINEPIGAITKKGRKGKRRW